MKKVLGILAVSAILASCGGGAETKTEETVKAADSTVAAAADTAKAVIDSTTKAAVDTVKAKVDSAVKK